MRWCDISACAYRVGEMATSRKDSGQMSASSRHASSASGELSHTRQLHLYRHLHPFPARTGGRTAAGGHNQQQQLARSGFVTVGSPEETVLETYFVMLSKMNFEKAKEQCVRPFRTQSMRKTCPE